MALDKVVEAIDSIERNMIRDFLISADFDSISKGKVNNKRRFVIIICNMLLSVLVIHSIIGFLADEKSSINLYSLNAYYAYGFPGRVWHGIYTCGVGAIILHAIVLLINEKRGHLTLITDMKTMYRNLPNPSAEETATFLGFLKMLLNVRKLAVTLVFIPMTCFRAVGAVLTAKELGSLSFLIAWCLIFIPYVGIQWYIPHMHAYTHLLIAQSTTYFELRLKRVDKELKNAISLTRCNAVTVMQRNVIKIKVMGMVNNQLFDLQHILNEINEHNRTIKYWLRDELVLTGCLFSFFLVQSVSDIKWYFKLSTFLTLAGWSGALVPSFTSSADLFVKIQLMSKLLHSCQTVLQNDELGRPRSVFYSSQFAPDPAKLVKTKYQVMRMIHRLSSPFLRVGYTEGDGESFSPASIGEFLSTVIFTTFMFLNSKSSVARDLLRS